MTLTLHIPNILWLENAIERFPPDEIISVLEPADYADLPCAAYLDDFPIRTLIPMSDFNGTLTWSAEDCRVAVEECGLTPPDEMAVGAILKAGQGALGRAKDRPWSVTIHCHAGVSRSPAAALLILALDDGPGEEARSCERLRDVAPWALPNLAIVSIGDRLLGRDGRLLAACVSAFHDEPAPEENAGATLFDL